MNFKCYPWYQYTSLKSNKYFQKYLISEEFLNGSRENLEHVDKTKH